MNNKIAGELAIGTILLLAIAAGGISWLQSIRQIEDLQQVSNPEVVLKAGDSAGKNNQDTDKKGEGSNVCSPRYYEGESEVDAWLAQEQSEDEGMIIQIKAEDAQKLPLGESEVLKPLTLKLVDATTAVKKDLVGATEENPVKITVRGYAEVCEQPPLVSIKEATVAFKKS